MMRRITNILLGAGAICLGLVMAAPVSAEQGASAPYEMMRALEVLQDQIAAGNAIAQVGDVKMIARMATRFASVDPAVWKDKRNARALVLYLFGGGNASALEGTIAKEQLADGYGALFEGAMAYGLGNDGTARSILMPIDARNLPSGLGGHLALVQATLVANQDKPKALQLLDLARLLEPGTLVEEAALRKEMFLIGATGDLDKFGLLARRYMHGFPKSIYAENFKQLQIKTAMEVAKAGDAVGNSRLDTLLNGMEPHERRSIYLLVAQNALFDGRTGTARSAAAAAIKLSTKPDDDEARANVYFGAATVATEDYDQGVQALKSADPSRLPARDAAIRASALEVADLIRSRASLLDASDPADLTGDPGRIEKTLNDAAKSLAASEDLLHRSVK
ncbi:MAG: hypothetical protein P4L76_11505 [Beijerinckiaceae bacterium]|nr:hypothetical protein [Beijerinckiaceae bacterium]